MPTAVTAIVVDVVVRDRDGKPVTDLKPTDFELDQEKSPAGRRIVHAGQPVRALPPDERRPQRRRRHRAGGPTAATQAPQVIALLFTG